MQELKRTSFFRLLAAAGQENCPDALNSLLYFWLRRMGVRIPEGGLGLSLKTCPNVFVSEEFRGDQPIMSSASASSLL